MPNPEWPPRRVLITNDDGIDAPGLRALEHAIGRMAEWVTVAPVDPHSECGHRVTTSRPVAVEHRDARRFAVHGTPADCVRLGLLHLVGPVDAVAAGINQGANLGSDLWISGTAAAAREATFRGVPAFAFSQYRRSDVATDWDWSARMVGRALARLTARAPESGWFWNVNLPAVEGGEPPELAFCAVDPHPLPVGYVPSEQGWHYGGNYHDRPREAGTDVDRCFRGAITVSLVATAIGSRHESRNR